MLGYRGGTSECAKAHLGKLSTPRLRDNRRTLRGLNRPRATKISNYVWDSLDPG